ncbi:MAG: WGR domain-containing protein, partial [Desulfobulbaceae bacterium]|nr:WGR domain-containing protein [Desulfobulbaceae bacterium]
MSQAQPVGFNMVKRLAKAHYPWYFYIENEKGSSNKFWSAKGSWENNPVEITWGRIGSKGTTITKPFSYFVKVAQKKLAKGYTYAVSDFLKEGLIEHGDKLLTYLTGWLLDFEATSPIITQELDSIGLQVAKAKWLLESEKVYKDIKHY